MSARQVALDVVVRTVEGQYLAPALRKALDASGLQGADRSLVSDLSYGTLRRLPQLDAALAPFLKAPDKLPPRVLVSLRIAAFELLYRGTASYAAVSAWVGIVKAEVKGLAPLANAVLRRVARSAAEASTAAGPMQGDALAGADREIEPVPGAGLHGAGPPGADHGIDPERDLALPAWLWREFVASLGEEAARAAALGMLEPEPLWLTAFSSEAVAVLREQGCEVEPGPQLGGEPGIGSLRVRAPVPLDRLTAYRDGLVQPQNPSSLYAALLTRTVGAPPPATSAQGAKRVLDLAAGQGIKTAVLAATGANVAAVEISAGRTRAAKSNLRRFGFEGAVEHVVADLTGPPGDELLAKVTEPSESVLLDAPCSGSGTLRGHPEIKLRLTPADVAALAATQSAMLHTAAALTAAAGRLVYAVCSLTPAEGPEQIASFLARHEEFRAVRFSPPLPHVGSANGSFVLPVDGLDGFYLSVLERE